MQKKIFCQYQFWATGGVKKRQSSEKPHLQLVEGSLLLSAPLWGKECCIGHEEEGLRAYYSLTISDKATLNNGFRYIKELLLYYHSYAMYEAYEAMKSENVRVYSVKSDAFTIHPHDMHLIKGS